MSWLKLPAILLKRAVPWSKVLKNLTVAELVNNLPRLLWNCNVHCRVHKSLLSPTPCVALRNTLNIMIRSCQTVLKTRERGPLLVGTPRLLIQYNCSSIWRHFAPSGTQARSYILTINSMMEEIRTSETSVYFHGTIWRYIPEICHLQVFFFVFVLMLACNWIFSCC
jgi:hypothetical protein